MQPLILLAASHTFAATVYQSYLQEVILRTLVNAKMGCWISYRRWRAEINTKSGYIFTIKETCADLNTFVMAIDGLFEVA